MTTILIITDKFIKYIKLISKKDIYDIKDQAIAYYNYIYLQFETLNKVISD